MEPHKMARATTRPHSRSPARSRSKTDSSPTQKRRRSPPGNSSSNKILPRIPPRPSSSTGNGSRPPYGSSYSWDSAQGQAFVDRVTARTTLSRSDSEKPQPELLNKDSPYMALVQLFNQFQGMPIDTKKMLVTVTVLGSTGPLRIVLTSDATVRDLIQVALVKYGREGRVPALGRNVQDFQLYSSPFSSQVFSYSDKVSDLGARNFVLCPVKQGSCASSSSSSSKSWWSYVTGVTGMKSLV